MNNSMLINLALISISWCSPSYSQYLNNHYGRVDNLYIYGVAAKVTIDKHNAKDVISFQTSIGTQVTLANGLNAVRFDIQGDTTISLPDDHPINKTIHVNNGKLDIIGGSGNLKVEKKVGNVILKPDAWGATTDITVDEGDVSLCIDRTSTINFDVYVNKWEAMNNRTETGLRWERSLLWWVHYVNEKKIKDASTVKIWAKKGTVEIAYPEQRSSSCEK
jgi:hypothetical protein